MKNLILILFISISCRSIPLPDKMQMRIDFSSQKGRYYKACSMDTTRPKYCMLVDSTGITQKDSIITAFKVLRAKN
jgi:hypothetical protein